MTPLNAIKAGLEDLDITVDAIGRRRASTACTVLAVQSGQTFRTVPDQQTLRCVLAVYNTNEGQAYTTACSIYDTLVSTFGPVRSDTNTWTLTDYMGWDIVPDPPLLLGPLGDERPVLFVVSVPLVLHLEATPDATP